MLAANFRRTLPKTGLMTDALVHSDKAFTGAIPVLYDRHLGSLLFEPYAADLAARVVGLKVTRVLEIAAGTGIGTRALCSSIPAEASIVATDLNQPMLDHAGSQRGQTILNGVRPMGWRCHLRMATSMRWFVSSG
jgi:hypothetical protein